MSRPVVPDLTGVRVRVVTCSDRASAGVYADRSGPLIVERVRAWGAGCSDPVVVPDGPAVGDALRTAVADGVQLVLTTGGTGLGPRDHTPEVTKGVLDRDVPGIPELIRTAGVSAGVPAAALSRGVAGISGRTLIVNLPGSTSGVSDALGVLAPLLGHALDQLAGGGH